MINKVLIAKQKSIFGIHTKTVKRWLLYMKIVYTLYTILCIRRLFRRSSLWSCVCAFRRRQTFVWKSVYERVIDIHCLSGRQCITQQMLCHYTLYGDCTTTKKSASIMYTHTVYEISRKLFFWYKEK